MRTSNDIPSDVIHDKMRLLQWEYLLGYLVMCILSIGLLVYIRRNHQDAFLGNEGAARKAILPAFLPLLVVAGVVSGVYTIFFTVALASNAFTGLLPVETFYPCW